MLIGLDYLRLHPIELVGSHKHWKSTNIRLNEDVAAIRHYAQASMNRVSIHPVYSYFESDDMGVVHPKRCGNCRSCKECSFRGRMLPLKDQHESQIIESKISHDQKS